MESCCRETFVELTDTMVADFDVIDFLHVLTDRSVQLLDVSAAGLLLADPRGELRVVAASSEAARLLELFQLQSDQGPCLDCFRVGQPVDSGDLAAAAQRWPRFGPAAWQAGFAAVQALPMRLRDQVIGALNLFRASPGAIPPADVRVGQDLADVATISLCQVAVAGLDQAVKAVAQQPAGEQGQQPAAAEPATERKTASSPFTCFARDSTAALTTNTPTSTVTTARATHPTPPSALVSRASARGMCSAVKRSRKSRRTDRRPISTPPATARTPARISSARPHPVRSKTAVRSVSCSCSDAAVCAGGVPARSRAVVRQKARYSRHPHDETAR